LPDGSVYDNEIVTKSVVVVLKDFEVRAAVLVAPAPLINALLLPAVTVQENVPLDGTLAERYVTVFPSMNPAGTGTLAPKNQRGFDAVIVGAAGGVAGGWSDSIGITASLLSADDPSAGRKGSPESSYATLTATVQ
jgi:hypothetical protein